MRLLEPCDANTDFRESRMVNGQASGPFLQAIALGKPPFVTSERHEAKVQQASQAL
jgi:hypothetical protein